MLRVKITYLERKVKKLNRVFFWGERNLEDHGGHSRKVSVCKMDAAREFLGNGVERSVPLAASVAAARRPHSRPST